jgi:lysophospholipase L1-like esterase
MARRVVKETLLSLFRIVSGVLLGAFVLLPPRAFFLFGLALLLLQAGIICSARTPNWRRWVAPGGIFLAGQTVKRLFWPIGLMQVSVVTAIAFGLMWAGSRAGRRPLRVALALASPVAYALLGAWAYGLWVPWERREAHPNGPVVFLGDSLTAGLGDDEPGLYVSRLREQFSTKLVNAGVAGDESVDALARLESDVLSRRPRLVVVMIGGNDVLASPSVPPRELKANISEIVRRLAKEGIDVVLVEVPGGAIFDRYLGAYVSVARRYRVLLIGEGMLRRIFLLSHLYTSDGIHLNAKGHALVARRVGRVLQRKFNVP